MLICSWPIQVDQCLAKGLHMAFSVWPALLQLRSFVCDGTYADPRVVAFFTPQSRQLQRSRGPPRSTRT